LIREERDPGVHRTFLLGSRTVIGFGHGYVRIYSTYLDDTIYRTPRVTEPGELAQAEAIAENISWLFGQSVSPLPWFPSSGSIDAEAMQFYEELDGSVYPLVRLIALACSSNASDLAIGAAIRACK
jgi:hypothetical protein